MEKRSLEKIERALVATGSSGGVVVRVWESTERNMRHNRRSTSGKET
jgi:hypothetical protein